MKMDTDRGQSRHLLFLGILGFSELVETKGKQEISAIIENALKAFGRWEKTKWVDFFTCERGIPISTVERPVGIATCD